MEALFFGILSRTARAGTEAASRWRGASPLRSCARQDRPDPNESVGLAGAQCEVGEIFCEALNGLGHALRSDDRALAHFLTRGEPRALKEPGVERLVTPLYNAFG